MIYTSYFGNYKNFPEDSYILGVTRYPPEDIENCGHLAPDGELLRQFKNKEIDEFMFAVKYMAQLEKIDKEKEVQHLRDLEKIYQNVILCCYEKTGEFCHRHILAKWLDLNIEEL